jgi:hypothetical protein
VAESPTGRRAAVFVAAGALVLAGACTEVLVADEGSTAGALGVSRAGATPGAASQVVDAMLPAPAPMTEPAIRPVARTAAAREASTGPAPARASEQPCSSSPVTTAAARTGALQAASSSSAVHRATLRQGRARAAGPADRRAGERRSWWRARSRSDVHHGSPHRVRHREH